MACCGGRRCNCTCDDILGCVSAGDGLTLNNTSGEFAAQISGEPDNVVEIATDGGIYVPATTVDQQVQWVFDCGTSP